LDSAIRFFPHGEDLPGEVVTQEQVRDLLGRLEATLQNEGVDWADIGLLWIANSKSARSHANQAHTDQSIQSGITSFCEDRGWYPSLLGSSVLGSFFRSPSGFSADISDGLLVTAVASGAFDRIPVVHEINLDVADRASVGRRVLNAGLRAFTAKASESGVDLEDADVTSSSTGLLLTTGSGHIRADQAVDFKECYAIGQELLDAAEECDAHLVGGCATNRSKPQLQTLYYSEADGGSLSYRSTYNHAAVFSFLPYARARMELDHPYVRDEDVDRLDIKFNSHDQFELGRSFYVERVNGEPAVDFLERHWPYSREELKRLARDKEAIPAEADAHLVTIASSLSRRDKRIWPNIPVWLEEIDGTLMMRMVRAEDDDANYYLMRLRDGALRENARDLMASVRNNYRDDACVLGFLCESRKYVLNQIGSNAEATEMLNSAPTNGCVVGLYVNGEYSTGVPKSIGYHNYSQIGAVVARRPQTDLPPGFAQTQLLSALELFACHASRDKHTVQAFMKALQTHLRGTTVWMDEKKMKAGDALKEEIRPVVGRGTQLVIAFLSDRSVNKKWVRRELKWALKQEKLQKRTIVLPVVIDDREDEVIKVIKTEWDPKLRKSLEDRLYIRLNDFTEEELLMKAKKMANDIRQRIDPPRELEQAAVNPFKNL
jgi:hypothetical protein